MDAKNLPKWLRVSNWGLDQNFDYKKLKSDDLVSINQGETKYEAIISGLSEIAQTIKSVISTEPVIFSEKYSDSDITKKIWSENFGKIRVEGHTIFSWNETGEGINTVLHESYEEFHKVSYVNGTISLIYEFFLKEEGIDGDNTEITSNLEITQKNGDIDYLLKELKDYGFDYEFYFNESEVWFLLELNNEVSDKRLMDKISRDRALREQFEKLKSQELDN